MKANKLIQFVWLVLLLLVVSCTDDMQMDNNHRVEEGLPAFVQMKFSVSSGQAMTRAEQSGASENRVNNIYVFVFDNQGNLLTKKYCTEGNDLAFGDDDHSTGTVGLDTQSRNNVNIIAIANVDVTYGNLKADLDAIVPATTGGQLDQLKALVMRMSVPSIERSASFVMTGYITDVHIPPADDPNPDYLGEFVLERTDAKVKFVITVDPSNSAWTEFSFLPKEWTVKQVPSQSYVLEKEGDYNEQDAEYFNTTPRPFEEITRNGEQNLYTGGSFAFYMPENRKRPAKVVEEYVQREEWDTQNEDGNKHFTRANAHSTYVEMTGTLSYLDGEQAPVSADVRLTVHLGYSIPEGSTEAADINDYNTLRNHSYTYKVTIRGINDIITEVTDQNDGRPGYEGDVIYGSQEIFEYDAHYDRKLITIHWDDITDNMEWSVNTPFSRGIHNIVTDGDDVPQHLHDYRWIKFAINKLYNTDDQHFVKYPGDQNYNDPYPLEGQSNDEKPGSYYDNIGVASTVRMLDVHQLIQTLQSEKKKVDEGNTSEILTRGGSVTITAFVDEYLYYADPTETDQTPDMTFWKKVVDKEDRQLHIISKGARESPDGNSSIVHSKFSFKQRSISTIFNPDNEDLKTAWGLESVMETKQLPTGNVITTKNSTSNGRENCKEWLVGKEWSTIIGTGQYTLNSDYENAAYACMLRNRDLNGDNVIQLNEVRWYLAAIDQLTDIFLGEYALDEKARLYPKNKADRENKVRWHYTSSSFHSRSGDLDPSWWSERYEYYTWMLWAEEGASRGGSNGSTDDNGAKNTLFSYRCVRNLGMSDEQTEEEPSDLIQVSSEASGYYLIDVTRMSLKARRTNWETTGLPPHNELSDNNRPYAKFRVSPSVYPQDGTVLNWEGFQTYTGYQPGYRIPNQRELLIMSTRLSQGWRSDTYYFCQTAFSMDGQSPYSSSRDGFIWHSDGNFFLSNGQSYEKGVVRPIMDVAE